jgi:hypothetical protein
MSTTYDRLNQINRALDIYNFPEHVPLLRQLHAIRVLYGHQQYRYVPSVNELRTRLSNMAYEIYLTPRNGQLTHELMDTALEIGASLPAIETNRDLFERYERHAQPKPVKNIYSLQTITEDRQNVHHTSINSHIKRVVKQLVSDYPPYESIWSILQSELKKRLQSWRETNLQTLKFIKENPSTFTVDVTLKSLLISVFLFIANQPEEPREQLYQRLNEELDEMRGKCSTGHLSRLVNVLQGFSSKYTIEMNPEQEMKSFVYYYLNKQLQDAPEAVQDGMTDGTEAFRSYVQTPKNQAYFENRFGSEHSEYISQCILEFMQLR